MNHGSWDRGGEKSTPYTPGTETKTQVCYLTNGVGLQVRHVVVGEGGQHWVQHVEIVGHARVVGEERVAAAEIAVEELIERIEGIGPLLVLDVLRDDALILGEGVGLQKHTQIQGI